MGAPELYVVFYKPRAGNFQHWALYIKNGNEPLILQVVGEHPNFERNVVSAFPQNSRSFLGDLYIGVIGDLDIARVKAAADAVHVDNETLEWDCQDYVLEMLDHLENDFVLESDDEDYQEARKILKRKRGAMI